MIKGTTPSYTFILQNKDGSAYDTTGITKIKVSFQQGTTTITKTESDCTIVDNEITVSLSQTETLSLNADVNIQTQIKFLQGNSVFASKIKNIMVYDIINKEQLQ